MSRHSGKGLEGNPEAGYNSAALMSATGKSLTRSPIPDNAASALPRSGLMKAKNDPSSSGTVNVPSG